MKKLVLSLGLLLFVSGSMSAQKQYTHLKGQESPFNGEFNESRYVDVDSISYSCETYSQLVLPEGSKKTQLEEVYTLIKCSSDGLTDTLKYYYINSETMKDAMDKYVKKYSDDGKLVFSSWDMDMSKPLYSMGERKYLYDTENRISEVTTINNNDGAATVIVYDTIRFDYEFKSYFDIENLEYNTIYQKSSKTAQDDSLLVFYIDEGYYILYEGGSIYDYKITLYEFDAQNRLFRIVTLYNHPEPTSGGEASVKEDTVIEYKYTNNGYEEFINEAKVAEYKFQDDGYCMEISRYEVSDAAVYPPISNLKTIEKFSYFKDGEIIVDNIWVESNAPKAYGVQGGITVITEKSLPVSIYTFSGGLVKQEKVSDGTNTIPMTKGLYVVVIGSMSYKILVQ